MLDTGVPEAAQRQVLSRFGFSDPTGALKHLRAMMTGSSLGAAGDLDARTREAFRAVAPALLTEIGGRPDPDLALASLAAFLSGGTAAGHLYAQLQSPQFRRLVIDVCARSVRLARALARRPLLLESIATDPGTGIARFGGWTNAGETLPGRREQAETVAGVKFTLGLSAIDEYTDDLSAIADAVVAEVYASESRRARCAGAPLAVVALGKLGSREMLLDADIDLLFLSDTARWRRRTATLATLAQNVVTRLGEVTVEGRLYEVDTRLRPEGRNAPLVTDASAFLDYLGSRASLWERQTMTRFRPIAGDPDVVEKLRERLMGLVYDAPLPAGWVETIRQMRRSMESRIRTRGPAPVDLKLSHGGLVDVEFIMQMHLLARGPAGRRLHAVPVLDALAALGSAIGPGNSREHGMSELPAAGASAVPGVNPEAFLRLAECYRHFRESQAFMRLTLEERGNVLPEGPRLERLARVHTGAHAEEYRAHMLARMSEVRAITDGMARALASAAGTAHGGAKPGTGARAHRRTDP
jgi:glutamate-ammonia-ligase adenylyltransferase